ncbi:protein tyrosine phosphatase [uncultured Methylovirgula sp.]|uniref:tyrosine phosphatase family protein n=1 Tax=uncultured Methylovirgula sp. TaxID=1285960 RepID=UPI002616F610|nr:protein tyrosine phosphatase [uncultured Methylovirgula sp.]
MPRLHVCSLFRISEITEATGAKSLVTLINRDIHVERPPAIAPERHLHVAISDICEATEGHVLADAGHVETLIDFVRAWDRAQPLVIHCFAGVSRSTAAAYITACALSPDTRESEIARRLRHASPTATPNAHLVGLADRILARGGRMSAAIKQIGRGADCIEAEPFALDLN